MSGRSSVAYQNGQDIFSGTKNHPLFGGLTA